MYRLQPRSTLTATIFPYSLFFRSSVLNLFSSGRSFYVAICITFLVTPCHAGSPEFGSGGPKDRRSGLLIDPGGFARLPGTDDTADMGSPLSTEEHTSELQSIMRISYAVLCLKEKTYIPLRRS